MLPQGSAWGIEKRAILRIAEGRNAYLDVAGSIGGAGVTYILQIGNQVFQRVFGRNPETWISSTLTDVNLSRQPRSTFIGGLIFSVIVVQFGFPQANSPQRALLAFSGGDASLHCVNFYSEAD